MTDQAPVTADDAAPTVTAAPPRIGDKARRTRSRLLDAARDVFSRDGFVEARVTDIASGAGVSHGTFYTYFTSKEDVFQGLALTLFDAFERSPRLHPPIDDAAAAYDALLEMNRKYALLMKENAVLMRVWRQAASVNTELRDLLQSERDLFYARAERGIQRFRALGIQGPVRPDAYAARALGGMVEEYCSSVFSRPDNELDFEESVRVLTDIWAVAVGIPVPHSSRD